MPARESAPVLSTAFLLIRLDGCLKYKPAPAESITDRGDEQPEARARWIVFPGGVGDRKDPVESRVAVIEARLRPPPQRDEVLATGETRDEVANGRDGSWKRAASDAVREHSHQPVRGDHESVPGVESELELVNAEERWRGQRATPGAIDQP